MKAFVLGMVAALVACSSSSKKVNRPEVLEKVEGRDREPSGGAQNKGDMTVTSSTGDDLSWLRPVYFAFDSSELLPPTRDTLARLHDWMASNPTARLTIEGHCDEQGTTEYNVALGQRRAQAIVDYLARLGTDRRRVTPMSWGSERPAVDGHDEVAWSQNRRGEFRVGP